MPASIQSFSDINEAARQRMRLAYRDLFADYWNGKNAFRHRFDNFRNMVSRRVAPEKIDQARIEDAARKELETASTVALYFGVPWCIQTCSFCDLAYSRKPNTEEKIDYINHILQEVENAKRVGINSKKVASVYFGGGTPSILETDLLYRYIDSALSNFDLVENAVVTLEASPATLSPGKLEAVKPRVSRISLGVQTTDTELRQREGRILPREKLLERINLALENFKLVNADVLYGMNGQSMESIYQTLCDLVAAGVPSITYYRTELFQNTKSFTQAKLSPWGAVEEINAREMYFFGKVLLEDAGYVESPLGWFVKKANTAEAMPWSKMVARWGHVMPYFGFGMGAFSTSTSYWMQNVESAEEWRMRIKSGKFPTEKFYSLSNPESFLVRFMRHIRAFNKIELAFLMEQSGSGSDYLKKYLESAIRQGLLVKDGDFIELTEAGASVIHWLIDDVVQAVTNNKVNAAA